MANIMISIPLVLTKPHACSYLPDRQSQTIFVHPSQAMSTSIYSQLIQQGFRRSGDDVYIPHCLGCSACIPARLAVENFKANRSQQRCWQKNHDTTAVIKPARFDTTHYQLYLRYQQSRHSDSDMAKSSPDDYIQFLSSSWCDTVFIEFSIAGELAGLAVVDVLKNALSAVYTFFDPKFSHNSLGVYAVLWQINHAKHLQKDFVYLGYWIKECQKMAYKSNYQPLQILRNKQWSELSVNA